MGYLVIGSPTEKCIAEVGKRSSFLKEGLCPSQEKGGVWEARVRGLPSCNGEELWLVSGRKAGMYNTPPKAGSLEWEGDLHL